MNVACSEFRTTGNVSRRCLLKAGTAGFAGLNLPSLLRAAEKGTLEGRTSKAKHIIFLHQFGGPSHLDTFDMKPDAPDGIRGEFKPINSAQPGLRLTEHLPNFARVLSRFAQIRSVNHRIKNHNPATYYSLTGHAPPIDDIRLRDTQELYPAYGSTVSRFAPVEDPGVPTFVSYPHLLRDGSVSPGQGASFLGKAYDPFFVSGRGSTGGEIKLPELSLPASLSLDRLDDRRGLLQMIDRQGELGWNETARGLDSFYDRALTMLASPKVKRAFDLSKEDPRLRDAYGRSTYGQSCLLARRLVEAGVRFVTVYYSPVIGGSQEEAGWDTHGDNFNQLKNRLLPNTDHAVPTLIEDLASRGLLDDTMVVWMGEFGRSPRVTNTKLFGANGRDHWPQCYTALFAGGGVAPGAIHGSSDRIGAYPSSDPVTPDDLAATMFWALGIDPATEFYDTLKRPLRIAAGEPVTSIFS